MAVIIYRIPKLAPYPYIANIFTNAEPLRRQLALLQPQQLRYYCSTITLRTLSSTCTVAAATSGRTASALLGDSSLHHLPGSIKHDVDQRIERRIRVRFLSKTILKGLTYACVRHVGQVVAHDRADCVSIGARHLLHDVA